MATIHHEQRLARERARQPRCTAIRHDGKPCRSFASGVGDLCFAHDPVRREEAQAARRKGGAATRHPRFADVLRGRMEAEIDKIIAAQVAALDSSDERIRLHAAEALLAAARGPKHLRALPPVLRAHAWTMADMELPNALAIHRETE